MFFHVLHHKGKEWAYIKYGIYALMCILNTVTLTNLQILIYTCICIHPYYIYHTIVVYAPIVPYYSMQKAIHLQCIHTLASYTYVPKTPKTNMHADGEVLCC